MTQAAALGLLPADNYAFDQSLAKVRDSDQDFGALWEEVSAEMEASQPPASERGSQVADADEFPDASGQADETTDQTATQPAEAQTDSAADGQDASEQQGVPADQNQHDQVEDSTTPTAQDPMPLVVTQNVVAKSGVQEGSATTDQTAANVAQGPENPTTPTESLAINVLPEQSGQSSESSAGVAAETVAEKPVLSDGSTNPDQQGPTASTSSAEQTPSQLDALVPDPAQNTPQESPEAHDADPSAAASSNTKQNIAMTSHVAANTFGSDLSSTPQQRQGSFLKQSPGHGTANGAFATAGIDKPNALNTVPGIAEPEAPSAADMAENAERIVKAARAAISRGAARIEIRLEPPELGTLRIEIKQNAAGLTLELQAGNARAQQLLQRNVAQLHQMLEANGLPTNQINVQLRTELQDSQLLDQDQTTDTFAGESSDDDPASQDSQQQDSQSEYYAAADVENTDSQDESTGPVLTGAASSDGWRELEFAAIDITV